MSTKWSTEVLGSGGKPDFAALLKDESTVILMRGKNVFSDLIYCYLKVTYSELAKLEEAISGPNNFNISDFGTVIAAGKGEPDSETQAEIATSYPMMAKPIKQAVAAAPAAKQEKKAWDEY